MKILITGDFSPRDGLKTLIKKKQFNELFGMVKQYIAKSDFSIVNFESTVEDDSAIAINKCGPAFSCPVEAAETLRWCGFNVATLANNHTLDYGDTGLYRTIEILNRISIQTVGAGCNLNEASKFHILYNGDCRIAVINCCEEEFSVATNTSAGTNPLRPVDIYYQIKSAKKIVYR